MGSLIIAGEEVVDLGSKFLNFRDTRMDSTLEMRFDALTGVYSPGAAYGIDAKNRNPLRYSTRTLLRRMGKRPSLEAAKAVIRKFVLHHDGLANSKQCWNVLHNERGLSCHFLIDNDGTIYQTLDLALMGYHAAGFNGDSIGAEICNRGILDRLDYYQGAAFPHKVSDPYSINGHKMTSFDFTDAQYEAFLELSRALVKVLPNLALEYPRDPQNPSKQAWGTLGPITATGDSIPSSAFSGFLGHYHLTTRKWDPGPFDYKKWVDKLRGQRVFPVSVPGSKTNGVDERPLIPEEPAALPAAIQPYYDANEVTAGGGFFPVGPWGVTRLWHGGVHIPAESGAPVYAPFPGRVIASRMGGSTPIGSNNFVLIRHDLNVASQQVRVYSLFMHLAEDSGGADAAPWTKGASRDLDPAVSVRGHDEIIDGGSIIGHVGTVGPGDLSSSQIHFEIFSIQRWFETKPDDPNPSPFRLSDGSSTGRFCEDDEINSLIDRDHDGRLSRRELTEFYGGSDKASMRDVVTLHVSEWAPEPDWTEELTKNISDLKKKSAKIKGKKSAIDDDDDDLPIKALVDEQLTPFLWWTDAVAKELGLPASAIVYHYHPLRFIEYANAAHAVTKVTVQGVAKSDLDDTAGDSAFNEPPPPPPPDMHLKIENLVDGYDGDKPAP
jgi:N-acetylmuramoyl-L-alanine amidase